MIKRIKIKDYILIDSLDVEFDKGLNVITGETGAGKSILINAIDIAFGTKCSKEVVRTGCDKAVIELYLENKKHDLKNLFDENGIDEFGDEIVLSREITPSASRSRVNGTLVNQEFMRALKELFLDIHSQHQTYSFLQHKYHIRLLDSYGKDLYGEKLLAYRELYKAYLDLQKELANAKDAANATESQIDFLKFQVKEIEEAQIEDVAEDEKLENELSVLENAEKLQDLTGASYYALNNDDGSILDALADIKSNLSKASSMDSSLEEVENTLLEGIETLKDVSSTLRDYSQSIDNDTVRLNLVQERLFSLDKLKRKYGGTLEKVLETYDDLSSQLNKIEFSTKNVEELEEKIEKVKADLETQAAIISKERKNYADVLSAKIVEKLENLELPKSRFEIAVNPSELGVDGIDDVQFMISTNVSEDLKPLDKVASGGEISRVMLAIKSIFAQNDDIDTVIFDEIDTGISGKASQSVADEIRGLADFRQIILITHQAIIASKAQKHFFISKTQNGKTLVDVAVLSGDEKLKALAQMAAGDVTQESLEFAKSLVG